MSMTHSETDAIQLTTQQPPKAPETTAIKKSNNSILSIMVIFFLLLALGAAFILWQSVQVGEQRDLTMRQQIADHSEALVQVEAQVLKKIQEETTRALNSLTQAQTQIQNQQILIEDINTRTQKHQTLLDTLAVGQRDDWQLAEAEYLLKLANQLLAIEHQPQKVLPMLKRADQILQDTLQNLGHADLLAVRSALQEDILAVENSQTFDFQGVYLRLNALITAAHALPRILPPNFESNPKAALTEIKTSSVQAQNWWSKIGLFLSSWIEPLDNYIRIDSVKTPVKPLVDNNVLQLANMNFQLSLQQAQMAALKEEPLVFKQSLQQASQMLTQYHAASPEAQQFQNQIHALEALDVQSKLPDISKSLNLMLDYLKRKHASNTTKNAD